MAIYHLSVKPVSRGGGRSATAAAAYRAAEIVHDHTTGQTFDYSIKRGVEHAEIVLPTACARQDVNWARDREALWNEAERAENRSNSRIAREYEIALPHELTRPQRLELVREFAAEIANRHGVAVDFAIHAPHREGDERNWHAHLLATTRVIEPGGLGEKSTIEWSDTNRRKAELEPARKEIEAIRERWAELTNEKLLEHGHEIRIDHRSLEAQGIEREAGSHLGPAVAAMERRGMETEVGRRIAWELEAAAQHRLERAAELGKVARESREITASIIDVSGNLEAAKREREWVREPEKAQDRTPARSLEELQKEGREKWLVMREAAKAAEAERSRELAPQVDLAMQNLRLGRVIETPALVAWRESLAARPIEYQAQVLEAIERRLQEARHERLARTREHVLARSGRRERAVQAVYAREPRPPAGLLSGLRRRAYEESHRTWQVEERRQERLREQARTLDRRLEIAQDPLNLGRHARSLMLERDPGLIERVHEYRQRQREIERERSRTLERGRDRDLDLSR